MTIDSLVSAKFRQEIEGRYYAKINWQAHLEQLRHDNSFWQQPETHAAIFADHGVVHMRDVVNQTLSVLERVHGRLIPFRTAERYERMRAYGVLLACLHDIGMVDMSKFGREMHPQYAAQAVFKTEFDEIVAEIAQNDGGDLVGHLEQLSRADILESEPAVVLRELLAMASCHSKRRAPMEVLNDRSSLRSLMLDSVGLDLHAQYETRRDRENQTAQRFYKDYWNEAFIWLTADHPALIDLCQDVVDVLRVLRCADGLRQRGSVLKTSGGYEIMVDRESADAIIAFRLGDDRLYLLQLHDQIAAGEANIASSELDPACDLRITFHRGSFASSKAVDWAANCAALAIDAIQSDAVESFGRPDHLRATAMRIILEETDDNLAFATSVQRRLVQVNPVAGERVEIVPSLKLASDRERERYLLADMPTWGEGQRVAILEHVEQSGHPTGIDMRVAFQHVRAVRLAAGDVLLDAGAPAAFVYIPLGKGLEIVPLGGYQRFPVQPWMPLGVTGVISGAPRNATVRSTEAVDLLMIPKMIYLQHWNRTHTIESFAQALD